MLDSKRMINFGPWSYNYDTAWSQGCDPRSHPSDPWSHIPRYDPSNMSSVDQ